MKQVFKQMDFFRDKIGTDLEVRTERSMDKELEQRLLNQVWAQVWIQVAGLILRETRSA